MSSSGMGFGGGVGGGFGGGGGVGGMGPGGVSIEQLVSQGSALAMSGKFREASAVLEGALGQDGNHVEAHRMLGLCLVQLGETGRAVGHLERACELSPSRGDLWATLGSTFAVLGQIDRAIGATERAVAVDPKLAQAHGLLATLLLQRQDLHRAEHHYVEALKIQPNYPEAQTNYGVVLNMTARQDEAMEVLRRASRENPTHLGVWTNYAVACNYSGSVLPGETFAAHVHYGEVVGQLQPLVPVVPVWPNARDAERRLRVGLLSADLMDHSVAYFLLAVLDHRDRSKVEYIGYSTSPKMDAMTQRLGRGMDGWRDVSRLGDGALIQQLRADQCDVLVELSGHTMGHKLAALRHRAAPVQVTYCGYPNTTGVRTIDYRIVDSITDPPGEPWSADQRATERLVRLDPCFLCFTGDQSQIAEHTPPVDQQGFVTFGSFNSIKKITAGVVELWSRCLHAVPRSRLVIKSGGLSATAARERLTTLLKQNGIAEVRFDLVDRLPVKSDHLSAYGGLDIALDTFPYNGTTTTCEALWMGVPVVTMAGVPHASRVSTSLLRAIGLEELSAGSPEEFVAIASRLAGDVDRLRELRRTMRSRMLSSPLCDGAGFARRFEGALREMWRGWCAGGE